MRHPCSWTLEEVGTDTLIWKWQLRTTNHRRVLCFCHHKTPVITHLLWEVPNTKRSELNISDKIKWCFENTPLWTELWKKNIMAVKPVFLYLLVNQLIEFRKMSALTILQILFSRYGTVDKIDPEENSVKTMGPYNPVEPLDRLIETLEKGREFMQAGGQMISDIMMISKRITFLA